MCGLKQLTQVDNHPTPTCPPLGTPALHAPQSSCGRLGLHSLQQVLKCVEQIDARSAAVVELSNLVPHCCNLGWVFASDVQTGDGALDFRHVCCEGSLSVSPRKSETHHEAGTRTFRDCNNEQAEATRCQKHALSSGLLLAIPGAVTQRWHDITSVMNRPATSRFFPHAQWHVFLQKMHCRRSPSDPSHSTQRWNVKGRVSRTSPRKLTAGVV